MRKRSQSMFVSDREVEDLRLNAEKEDDGSDENIENEEDEEENEITHKDWTAKTELTLVNRVKRSIPRGDRYPFYERLTKINWETVAFANFNEEDVMSKFKELMEKTRTFRLLQEILSDMSHEIYTRLEIPSKPKSAFSLFLTESKDKITKKCHRDGTLFLVEASNLFKNLSDKQKEDYAQRTLEMKKNYQNVMETLNLDSDSKIKREKKFKGPIHEYYRENYKDGQKVKLAVLRQQYAALPKEHKLSLILRWAGVDKGEKLNQTQYDNAKKVLLKDEMAILDEYEGKPIRPLNGYCLFLKDVYKKSPDHKSALKEARSQWQNLSSDIKKNYQEKGAKARRQYEIDFKNYLNSLPLDRLPSAKNVRKTDVKDSKMKILNYFMPEVKDISDNENDVGANEEFTNAHEEDTENTGVQTEKKKKRDRSKKSNKIEEVSSKVEAMRDIDEIDEPKSATPKKRKHSKVETSEHEVTPKKKKNKISESEVIETPSKVEVGETIINTEKEEEIRVKKSKKKKKKKEVSSMEETNIVDDTTYYEGQETVAEKIEKLIALRPPKSCYKYFQKNWYDGPKKQAKSQYFLLSADEKKSISKKYKRAKRKFLEKFQTFANSLSSQELEENEEAIGFILQGQGDPSDASEEEN